MVAGTGRSREFHRVRVILNVLLTNQPAVGFLGAVTTLAHPESVRCADLATHPMWLGVVPMTDRRIAVGRFTSLFASADEVGKTLQEHSRSGLKCHQSAVGRGCVKLAQRGPGTLIGRRLRDEVPGQRRGHRAVTGDDRRCRLDADSTPNSA